MAIDEGFQGFIPLRLASNGFFTLQYGDCTYNTTTGALDFVVIPSDTAGAFVLTNTYLRLPAGDFDIRMDYNLTNFPIPTASGAYAQLMVRIVDPALGGNVQSIAIGCRERQATPQQVFRGYTSDSTEPVTYVERPTDCLTSGKFRFIRSGTTVTAYYLSDDAWRLVVSKDPCNTTPWEMRLSSGVFSVTDTYTSNIVNMISVTKASDVP